MAAEQVVDMLSFNEILQDSSQQCCVERSFENLVDETGS